MTNDITTQWVCVDCFILLCNGDIGDGVEDPDALLSKFEGYHAMPGMRLEEHGDCCPVRNGEQGAECDCEHDTYSTSACDGCGSPLHGEREAVTIEPQHADYPHEPGTLYDCAACDMPA